ncbi:hypothetical protein E1A91_A07G129400v1 [Gossypium mustelinum]|uniref:Uncharacterized protein n=1 Tax=Gossypium mustelinum TaxID=34275 RepID=A0A5D2YJF5_GOSMU|nr:hypothetical protein E1A91_A07G129400v1 [Gossypium mustelinum]
MTCVDSLILGALGLWPCWRVAGTTRLLGWLLESSSCGARRKRGRNPRVSCLGVTVWASWATLVLGPFGSVVMGLKSKILEMGQ